MIPEDAGADMITAGLTAVAALAYRYDDDTPIDLSLDRAAGRDRHRQPARGRAGRGPARRGDHGGLDHVRHPDADADRRGRRAGRRRAGALDGRCSASPAPTRRTPRRRPSRAAPPRPAPSRTSASTTLALTGYGSVDPAVRAAPGLRSASRSPRWTCTSRGRTPRSPQRQRRPARRTRRTATWSARRCSATEATFDLDVHGPGRQAPRRSTSVELTLNAVAPDGSACTPPSIPPAEVDLDTGDVHGDGRRTAPARREGFQLFPQIFEGTLPVALRSRRGPPGQRRDQRGAPLIAALQRAGRRRRSRSS